MDKEMGPYCGAKHGAGFYCILQKDHEGDHLSVDNKRVWKGTPGAPVIWSKRRSSESMKESSAALDSTTTAGEARSEVVRPPIKFTEGDSCSVCGSMKVVRESSCRKRCYGCGTIDGGCG